MIYISADNIGIRLTVSDDGFYLPEAAFLLLGPVIGMEVMAEMQV